jgi:integrase
VDHRFWTFDERDRFLTYVKSRNREVHDLVAFAVHTGLRRDEVEGLLRDCVDYERREIIVKRNYCHKTNKLNEYTKGKTIRRVPMNDVVFEVLAQFRLLQPNQPVFQHDFQHVVKRYLIPLQEEAGVSVITFHDLRHSFASHLAMSGISVFDIQKLLGHSDIKTTMRYMHLAPDHLKGVTDVLIRGKRGAVDSQSEPVREMFGRVKISPHNHDLQRPSAWG